MKENVFKIKKNQGFTIIETMISIALFSIIVTIGMAALLNASAVHKKSQNMRSIMDNLSFIMEDMSRNLRTGYNYYCDSSFKGLDQGGTSVPKSCPNSLIPTSGIAFEPTDGGVWWGYLINSDGSLQKTKDSSQNYTTLTSSEIKLDPTKSGFTVIGAEPPPGDIQQPFVTIRLAGTITDPSTKIDTKFSLQTSISQRLLDNTVPVTP